MASILQPISPSSGPNKREGGSHWICIIFINLHVIRWTDAVECTSGGAQPEILVFDSVQPHTKFENIQLGTVKRSFQVFLAHEACARHGVPLDRATKISLDIPWRLVCPISNHR